MIPLLLLQRLRQVDPKRVTIVVLIVAFSAALLDLRLQSIELAKAELVYTHPQQRTKILVRKVAGPVRIVTKIVERADGERVTEIVEERAPIVETRGEETESTPVPLSITLAPHRADRWLLGAGLLNLSPRSSSNWTGYAGYGFRNRFDLLYGLSYNDRINHSILFVVRF
jgi:hypothetical protein